MQKQLKINRFFANLPLDENRSPVPRYRLMSKGVNDNTRLLASDQVCGDSACLACGNCVDNCPVVRQSVGRVFIQNQRTSMALENVVQEDCRRCYRCVNSCPQVSKTLKEYTLGYRRVEKIVHLLAALVIVSLAATGVTYSHYGQALGFEGQLLKYIHRTIGATSIVIPFLYFRFDVCHFRRTLKKIFSWGAQDREWLKNIYQLIRRNEKTVKVARHEFNPAQKLWYLFILSVFPILYLSGWATILLGVTGSEASLLKSQMVHMLFALSFDLMLFVHVYVKYLREWAKDCYQLYRNYQATKGFVFKSDLSTEQES